MSVPAETSEVAYTGNNATVDFTVTFPWLSNDQIVVTKDSAGDGNFVTQVEGVDYTLTGAGQSSGTVTFATAPGTGDEVLIQRTVEIVQDTAFRTQGTFSPGIHENALDYLTYICQQLARRVAVLEALGTLVPTTTYQGLQLEVTFTTDAAAVEDSFPVNVAMPAGTIAYGARVIKVLQTADPAAVFYESVDIPGWTQTGDNLVLHFVTGLDVNLEYTLTIEVLEEV